MNLVLNENSIKYFLDEKVDFKIIEKIKDHIYAELPGTMGDNDKYYNSILIAYYVRLMGESFNPDIEDDYNVFKNERENHWLHNDDVTELNPNTIGYEIYILLRKYPRAFKCLLKFSNKELAAYILNAENTEKCLAQSSLPIGVIKLAIKLLEIEPNSSVANFNAGTGNFECVASLKNPDCKFFMFETNRQNRTIARTRKVCISGKAFENYTQFPTEIFDNFNTGRMFNRVFCNVPIGTSTRYIMQYDYYKKLKESSFIYQKLNTVEWIYCERMIEMLKPGGIALALVSNGATYNNADQGVRKELLRKGYIKAVIQMPEKLLRGSNINFSLVVLSKGNKTCKLIDASEIFSKGRRQNVLKDNEIEEIFDLYKNGDSSTLVKNLTMQEFSAEDYSLNPSRYINSGKQISKNCVKLKELLVSEVSRGMNISANQLDSMSDVASSNYKFLTLGNINGGVINKEMISISNPNLKSNKYLVESNNLVIAKPSSPLKIAVAGEEFNDVNVVASDNIFVLKLNEERVNPYYLKAYFESETGKREIKRAISGTVTNMITKQQLENINVPLMPMDKQREIAERYIYNEKQIILLKERLEVLQDKLKEVWRAEDND